MCIIGSDLSSARGGKVVLVNYPQTVTINFYPSAHTRSTIQNKGKGKKFTTKRRLTKSRQRPWAQDSHRLIKPRTARRVGKDRTPRRNTVRRTTLPQTGTISENLIPTMQVQQRASTRNRTRDGVQQTEPTQVSGREYRPRAQNHGIRQQRTQAANIRCKACTQVHCLHTFKVTVLEWVRLPTPFASSIHVIPVRMCILGEKTPGKANAQVSLVFNRKLRQAAPCGSRVNLKKSIKIFPVGNGRSNIAIPLPLQSVTKLCRVDTARVETTYGVFPKSSRVRRDAKTLNPVQQDHRWGSGWAIKEATGKRKQFTGPKVQWAVASDTVLMVATSSGSTPLSTSPRSSMGLTPALSNCKALTAWRRWVVHVLLLMGALSTA